MSPDPNAGLCYIYNNDTIVYCLLYHGFMFYRKVKCMRNVYASKRTNNLIVQIFTTSFQLSSGELSGNYFSP